MKNRNRVVICGMVFLSIASSSPSLACVTYPPMAVTYPDPAFWPVAAMGHDSLEICGGASYDTDPGTPTCCDYGIDYHDWSVEETCGNGWIEGYETYPNGAERQNALVQFDCIGKHNIWHTVTDFGGTPSDATLSYAWVFDISASLSQSVIGVGDTATLTMDYSPSDLPGYKKLKLTGGVGAVEVLEGERTVISGADTSETWQLGSRFDPGLVTVKGISACYQATLWLQFTPDGSNFPSSNYNGNSVTVKVVEVYEVVKAGTGEPGPLYVPLNGTMQLKGNPWPEGPWPSGRPTWEFVSQPGTTGVITPSSGSDTVTISGLSVAGQYVVKAKCGALDDGATITVYAVGVDRIQYKVGNDPYQDCPNPLAVAKGADVTFKAIKKPAAALWPTGKPVWSGSSGASGTGEEKAVDFDTASNNPTDYKVVQVECGNSVSVNVVVVDLSTLVINANRTSAPVESSFPVKSGEHFELGGIFKFDLMLNPWPEPVKLGAEIWDLDYINEVIASGSGASISHTFGTGGHDDGTCDVCFYFDNNTSGDSRTGCNDPQVDSYDFEVQELTYHYLTFAKSSAVAGTPDTGDACRGATDLILRKDTADDYRATAKFIAAGLSTIPASTHDPVYLLQSTYDDNWGDWSYFRDYDSSEVIIVEDLTPADAQKIYLPPDIKGISKGGIMYDILLDDSFFIGEVLAHEVGHSCGLGHNTSNQDMIMFSGGTNRTLLTESEASGFE